MGGHRRVPSQSDYTQSWEPSVAETIANKVEQFEGKGPYMVGLTGVPGSGTTIAAMILANLLDSMGLDCFVMSCGT